MKQSTCHTKLLLGICDRGSALHWRLIQGRQHSMKIGRVMRMNYTIAMRTKDAELADKFMWDISNYLETVDDIPSNDDSYIFQEIEQTGLPSMSEQDEQGYTDYMLNFFVQIITRTNK